jgi:molecular chaperone GrpE
VQDDFLNDNPDPADAPPAPLPMEPADQAVQRLERELDEVRDRHLRLAAEFDNFRKRVSRERVELSDRAQAAFISRLLEVLDDLDRLAEGETATSAESLREAITLIDRKFRKELEAAGVERIDPAGQPFNPAEHEAVATLPAPDASRDHEVSATFQPGYRFKGTLVRPARVQVFADQGQA